MPRVTIHTPRPKSSVQKEYRRCDRLLAVERDLSEYDRGILYGGRQAMGWLLQNNCAKPSVCVAKALRCPP